MEQPPDLLISGISFLGSQAVGIVHPVAFAVFASVGLPATRLHSSYRIAAIVFLVTLAASAKIAPPTDKPQPKPAQLLPVMMRLLAART